MRWWFLRSFCQGLVEQMGEGLELRQQAMGSASAEDRRRGLEAHGKALRAYRHGPEVGERRIHPHDLRGIVGQDGRIAGFVCRRCSRVAWLNKGFADCSEADADVIQQLGDSCEGAEVDEA